MYQTIKVDPRAKLGSIDQGRMIIVPVPVAEIRTDPTFPVEPDLVKRYRVMALQNGFIPAVLLRLGPDDGLEIVDGYHRVAVAILLGLNYIDAQIVECSEQQFWDMRIGSAISHHTVADDRLHVWMLEAWTSSDWAKQDQDDLARAAYAIYTDSSQPKRRKRSDPGAADVAALRDWFAERGRMWGRPVGQISKVILEKSGLVSRFETTILDRAVTRGLDYEQFKRTQAAFRPDGNRPRREPLPREVDSFIDLHLGKPSPEQIESIREQAAQTPLGQKRAEHNDGQKSLTDAREKLSYLQSARHRIGDIVALPVDLPALLDQEPHFKAHVAAFFTAVDQLAARLDLAQRWDQTKIVAQLARAEQELREALAELQALRASKKPVSPLAVALSSAELERIG